MPVSRNNLANPNIRYVFVLMMENRSFDHMLGFSGITGTDAVTGKSTSINGLTDPPNPPGVYQNSYNNTPYPVTMPADIVMPLDPGHGFDDVLEQLGGQGAAYPYGGPYPSINNSGFVANYASVEGNSDDLGEIMKCYAPAGNGQPAQLPVLTTLASTFAVCDNWYASLPGPTWPNRFFVHAASSGGLDDTPTMEEIAEWEGEFWGGFAFPNGTVYDLLNNAGIKWRIYEGAYLPLSGSIPNVTALKGVSRIWDVYDFAWFRDEINDGYAPLYTFIEPNYGDVASGSYSGGQSQHPQDSVLNGEQFIKEVYEAIFDPTCPLWDKSMLIITYDEHGGFYDHVQPGTAIPPGDEAGNKYNNNGFPFNVYGVRVPAVVVSAYTPNNIIDHRLYDHSSVPATLEAIYELPNLTDRDAKALDVTSLASLSTARTDMPVVLPDPGSLAPEVLEAARAKQPPFNPAATVNDGNLPGFVHAVAKAELEMAPTPEERAMIIQRVKQIRTKGQAKAYMEEAVPKIQAAAAVKQKQSR